MLVPYVPRGGPPRLAAAGGGAARARGRRGAAPGTQADLEHAGARWAPGHHDLGPLQGRVGTGPGRRPAAGGRRRGPPPHPRPAVPDVQPAARPRATVEGWAVRRAAAGVQRVPACWSRPSRACATSRSVRFVVDDAPDARRPLPRRRPLPARHLVRRWRRAVLFRSTNDGAGLGAGRPLRRRDGAAGCCPRPRRSGPASSPGPARSPRSPTRVDGGSWVHCRTDLGETWRKLAELDARVSTPPGSTARRRSRCCWPPTSASTRCR